MYQAYQAHADLMWPWRTAARLSLPMLTDPAYGAAGRAARRQAAAACRVFELGEVTHRRPPWNIASVLVEGRELPVVEEATWVTPFATLRRFRKDVAAPQPRVPPVLRDQAVRSELRAPIVIPSH